MSLPGLPVETGDPFDDLHSLWLWLQRLRDGFPDAVASTPGGSTVSYTDEQSQDAVAAAIQDSATVDFTYNDPAGTMRFDVRPKTTPQLMEVSRNGAVVSTEGNLNFVETSHDSLSVSDAGTSTAVSVDIAPSRLVGSGETTVLKDTHCLLVANYYRVVGAVQLLGDSTLRIT